MSYIIIIFFYFLNKIIALYFVLFVYYVRAIDFPPGSGLAFLGIFTR